MDPLALALLAFVALVTVAAGAVVLSADFRQTSVRVRGGTLRSAVTAALLRLATGEAEHFSLPLVVQLEKTGLFGARTPLPGPVIVRDVDLEVRVDGTRVSTLTEAVPVTLGARTKRAEIAIDARVHRPDLETLKRLRRARKDSAELRIDVVGTVRVRLAFGTRRVPIRDTTWVVAGPPRPRLAELRWLPAETDRWDAALLRLRVENPYHEEAVRGTLALQLVAPRPLLPDPLLATQSEPLTLPPGAAHLLQYEVRLESPAGNATPAEVEVAVRPLWDGSALALPTGSLDTVRLTPRSVRAPDARLRAVLVPVSPP